MGCDIWCSSQVFGYVMCDVQELGFHFRFQFLCCGGCKICYLICMVVDSVLMSHCFVFQGQMHACCVLLFRFDGWSLGFMD